MMDLIKKVAGMSQTERITRLCELGVKSTLGGELDPFEELEITMIQQIREMNGEIEEVLKNKE